MLKHRVLALIPVVCAAAMLAPAAENDGNVTAGTGEGGRRWRDFGARRPGPGGMGGSRMEAFRKVQEEIKAKLPAEYAEYEKLQSTDRRAAREKLRELATKAGVSMPSMRPGENRRRGNDGDLPEQSAVNAEWQKVFEQLKAKFPEEFAEIQKLLSTDSAAALKKLQALAAKAGITLPETPLESRREQAASIRNSNRYYIRRANRMLQRSDPQGYAELEKLRAEDEDAAREKFRSMVKQAGITLEQLRVGMPGEGAGVIIVKQLETTNSSTVSTRRSGGNWGGMRGNGGPPPPPPGM